MRDSIIMYDGTSSELSSDMSHYVYKVLRKSPGDIVTGYDGYGNVYSLELASVSKNSSQVIVQEKKSYDVHSPSLTLILSAFRPQRLEIALEKCTELGVSQFILTETEFSSFSLDSLEKKSDRFQSIITQACLQSEQPWFPTIVFMSMKEILDASWDSPFVGVTKETSGVATFPKSESITLWIGPEGGFSKTEFSNKIESQFTPIHPLPTILRAETAAIALTTLAMSS